MNHIILFKITMFLAIVNTNTLFVSFNYSTPHFTPLKHFWRGCGFCPPDPKINISQSLLSWDQKLNLALIGSMPNRALRHVRIHWLVNMISIKTPNNTQATHNFTDLDKFLNWLHDFNLSPRFELMGENTEDTFVSKDSIYWYNLTTKIVDRYSVKFGKQFSKWKFETWNEPDLKGYNKLNFSLQEYLQYVNACASGIKDAFRNKNIDTPAPKFGGPAGLFKQQETHPFCWGLLEFCNNLKGFRCPLKYISFHKKGESSTQTLLNRTLELLDYIHGKYANIRRIPVANDEADILQNWSKSEDWRGDVRYAAMVAKVILDYQKFIVTKRHTTIELLSNDNCFLNYHPHYFTQRTLLTRFQMNNTKPPHIQFIKKPVYTVMGLLSLLGDECVEVDTEISDPLITTLATRSQTSRMMTLVIVYANNTDENGGSREVHVALKGMDGVDGRYVVYLMDNVDANPFLIWKRAGSPVFPSRELRSTMRKAQQYVRTNVPNHVIGSSLEVHLNLSLPSFAVVHVCYGSKAPGGVTKLRIYNITWNEVLLTWQDRRVKSKCILTYEVEFIAECGDAPEDLFFKRVNHDDTIFLSYHYAPKGVRSCESTRGRYRVRAVDYWYKKGTYSKSVKYSSVDTEN